MKRLGSVIGIALVLIAVACVGDEPATGPSTTIDGGSALGDSASTGPDATGAGDGTTPTADALAPCPFNEGPATTIACPGAEPSTCSVAGTCCHGTTQPRQCRANAGDCFGDQKPHTCETTCSSGRPCCIETTALLAQDPSCPIQLAYSDFAATKCVTTSCPSGSYRLCRSNADCAGATCRKLILGTPAGQINLGVCR